MYQGLACSLELDISQQINFYSKQSTQTIEEPIITHTHPPPKNRGCAGWKARRTEEGGQRRGMGGSVDGYTTWSPGAPFTVNRNSLKQAKLALDLSL